MRKNPKSTKKDIKRIIQEAKDQGFTVSKSKSGHIKWHAPDGKSIVVSSGTPSDSRAMANMKSRLKRVGLRIKNPSLTYRKLKSLLKQKGFRFIRQKGSHEIYESPTGKQFVLPRRKGGKQMAPFYEKQLMAASNPVNEIDRARELWVEYTIKPSANNLKKVRYHCETLMKFSSDKKVQQERARCLRAICREEKLLRSPRRNPISMEAARCRKRQEEFRNHWWNSLIDQMSEAPSVNSVDLDDIKMDSETARNLERLEANDNEEVRRFFKKGKFFDVGCLGQLLVLDSGEGKRRPERF